jgi:ribosomal protein L37AE/L43A
MPQCKIDGCKEQAQPYGKRLCPEHEARRAAKAKAYFAKPKCAFCGTQHTDNKNDQGIPECPSCRNARFDREYEQSKKNGIVNELMACSDLDQLKNFILIHLMER